jgi:hypothetical protein
MGEAGRKRVEQNFTSTRMAAALLQVYQEMLSDPCRADVPSKHPQSEEVVTVPAKWA